MSRRHKKKRKHEEVSLNMAAMLDMAFQLLTFFILTYKQADVEGQITLRMPDPAPVSNQKGPTVGHEDTKDPLAGLHQLVVSIYSNKNGDLESIAVGEKTVATTGSAEQKLNQLDSQLHKILTDPAGSPFDTIVLQVGSGMRYEDVMQVVDRCARQTLHDGKPLSKLTFLELPEKDGPK